MEPSTYSDEQLNLFIDQQLDTDEMHLLRQVMLNDAALRERVCQLKAVRELVGVAYEQVPRSSWERRSLQRKPASLWKSMAACLLLCFGALIGWQVSQYSHAVSTKTETATAAGAFNFFANLAASEPRERKIVLHISTDDIGAVNAALEEAGTLLASYKETSTPLKIDIVANKDGINLLRLGVSPYVGKLQSLVNQHDVSLYACENSLMKARHREGGPIQLLPGTYTHKAARDLIPERLEEGWVYIKV